MQKLYTFSPIKSEQELLEAIKFIHFACFELCKKAIGKYLPVASNIGIFCQYEDEYEYLTKIREKITEPTDNINQKYFRLHESIIIPAKDDVPETTYHYLYIRKPDPYRHQVGDLDFYLEPKKYLELKNSLVNGVKIKGARVFDRSDLDMIELHNPDIDALGYISTHNEAERVRVKISK